MRQISNSDYKRLNAYPNKLREAAVKVSAIIAEIKPRLDEALANLNEERAEAEGFIADLLNVGEEYFDARSEKWQVDDAGSEYSSWLDDIRDLESNVGADFDLPIDVGTFEEEIAKVAEAIENLKQAPDQ